MITRDRNLLIELEGGKKIGLRVNNWALKEAQKKTNCTGVNHLYGKIGMLDGNPDLDSFIIFIQECVSEYNLHQKIEGPFPTDREASEYIDAMGGIQGALLKVSEIFNNTSPNVTTPETPGEQISQ